MHQFTSTPSGAGFEQIALKHEKQLRRLAFSLTREHFDSDDLVQDTYLRAYLRFGLFRRGTNCLAWLSRIMVNLFINEQDRRRRKAAMVPRYCDFIKGSDGSRDPREAMAIQDGIEIFWLDDELLAAMRSLPPLYREVLILSDLLGMSYDEIARLKGMPVGSVRCRLSRGRSLVRRKFRFYRATRPFRRPAFA